jgi:hypothetical protein
MEAIKEIKVFLSCPGDLKDILPVVDEFLEEENIFLGKNYKIRLELKHWKKNIYPGKGVPRVQDRINEQLVKNCDIYVGILWTRFGMPPGVRLDGKKYGSGTEEEFFIALDLGIPSWFLFCDIPINPSKIEPEQLKKVNEFKKRLQEQQILYEGYTEEKEFRRKLKSYFSNWICEQYKIIPMENVAHETHIPTIEDFKKFNKGF